jgi:hypothetical protein
MMKPKVLEIWLVRFPFSDLTSTKLRPALVLAVHREELIILGIFSKIPAADLRETWVLISDTRKISGSLVAPSRSERGGKTTRADLSALKINVFHDVDHLYMPSRYLY